MSSDFYWVKQLKISGKLRFYFVSFSQRFKLMVFQFSLRCSKLPQILENIYVNTVVWMASVLHPIYISNNLFSNSKITRTIIGITVIFISNISFQFSHKIQVFSCLFFPFTFALCMAKIPIYLSKNGWILWLDWSISFSTSFVLKTWKKLNSYTVAEIPKGTHSLGRGVF